MQNDELINTVKAGRLLAGAPGVPEGTRQYAAKLCREGKLRASKIGGGRSWLIERQSVIEFRQRLEDK